MSVELLADLTQESANTKMFQINDIKFYLIYNENHKFVQN